MPSKVIEPACRHYPINNDWLDQYAHDSSKYVDIEEIKAGTSQYVNDLIAMGINVNVVDEQQKANFFLQAIYVGSIASGQNHNIRGQLLEDDYTDSWPVAETSFLQAKIRRVYASGTDARDLKFTGYIVNA